ncbi:cytochrome P450 [Scytonema tolypothrichoides VB-61278]|nr:cytochrome P450 [Scytonema tolypothrichoides VB-61278]
MQANQPSITTPNTELLSNPFPWYAKMRRFSPVFYDAKQQSWMVFRYEDVKQVFADWQIFSSKTPHPPEQTDLTQSLISTDPPKHRSLRSLVAKVFTARRVEELAPRITQITHELIDKVQGQERMDFMHDLAIPLPVIVISEILGVPIEDQDDFKRWSDGIVVYDPSALKAMADYFRHLLGQRRQNPGKDLISDLIAAHEAGETLTAQELVDFCMVLLVAGNETTTNLLGNAILCFNEYPETFEGLKQEPQLLPFAIEEVLRYRSPVQAIERFTKVETQLGGQTIPAGQMVTLWIGSANRDETQFDRPDQFVVDRNPNPHLSFGNGIHFCLGAPLARLEGKIVLNAVLKRLPNLHIAPNTALEFIPSMDLYGVKSLPVLL